MVRSSRALNVLPQMLYKTVCFVLYWGNLSIQIAWGTRSCLTFRNGKDGWCSLTCLCFYLNKDFEK
jgi:hypothetical protein